ncbi:hypothetical protein J4E91_010592 [Alternaria rosae]|nr:hypothetical protein J4E91_010592 [Alternaria rosae]
MQWLPLFLWTAFMAITIYAAPLDGPVVSLYENTTVVADAEVDVASTKYIWSGLGDSWASGVSYGFFRTTDYDGNMDHCLRINHTYAPQMSHDNSWIPEGREQELHFQSCSGTRWRQIDAEPHLGHIQLNDVPDNVDMILLQAGDNNANFTRTTVLSIPDPEGQCLKELEATKQYILGKGRDQLFQDARWIVNQVFDHPKVKKNPKFRLFIVSYFQTWVYHYAIFRDIQTSCKPLKRVPYYCRASMSLPRLNLLVEALISVDT